MNKNTVIAMLLKCANELDQNGLVDDANKLDGLASQLGGMPNAQQGGAYQNDLQSAIQGIGGGDDFFAALKNTPDNSTNEDDQSQMPQPQPKHENTRQFIRDLQDAGVKIQ